MNGLDHLFRRIVLELSNSYHDERTMHFLAEVAEALDLELAARYVIDPSLAKAAALPFNREYRLLENAWHPLNGEDLAQSLELSAAAARRRLEQIASAHRVRLSFEPASANIAVDSRTGRLDSVVAIGQRWNASLAEAALQAAFERAAGVLLLPRACPTRRGAILVAAEEADATLLQIGARLAERRHEPLITFGGPSKRDEYQETNRHPIPAADVLTTRGVGSFGPAQTKLVVARRGALDDSHLLTLVTRRNVPVLVIDR